KKPLLVHEEYIAALKNLFIQEDKLLLVEMLTLPSEKYIAEQMTVIDVDAIHHVREFILQKIAKHLQADFLQIYQENNDLMQPYQFNMDEMGKRQLKNLCLAYLMLLEDEGIYKNIAMKQ